MTQRCGSENRTDAGGKFEEISDTIANSRRYVSTFEHVSVHFVSLRASFRGRAGGLEASGPLWTPVSSTEGTPTVCGLVESKSCIHVNRCSVARLKKICFQGVNMHAFEFLWFGGSTVVFPTEK